MRGSTPASQCFWGKRDPIWGKRDPIWCKRDPIEAYHARQQPPLLNAFYFALHCVSLACVYVNSKYTHSHTHTHTHTHVYMYVYLCMCMKKACKYTRTNMYTHTDTHTRASLPVAEDSAVEAQARTHSVDTPCDKREHIL